jgi:hypothetical protein
MNKILAICFLGLLCAWNVGAQDVQLRFSSKPSSVSSYTFSSTTDVIYAVDPTTFSGNNSNTVFPAPYNIRIQVKVIILELKSTSASAIKVYGMSSGSTSNRTIYQVSVSDTKDGTYTLVDDVTSPTTKIISDIVGQDINHCTSYVSGLNISKGKFVKISFCTSSTSTTLQNVNVSGFDITPITSVPLISSFTVNGVAGTIDDNAGTITMQLPYGSNLNSLTPTVALGGSATSYSPSGAQDFTYSATTPIVYTVTDGINTKSYSVTINTPATPPAPQITLSSGSNSQTLKVGSAIQSIVYNLTNATGATISGLPADLDGSFVSTGTNQGTFTISGNINASVTPGTFNYTVTATPISGYSGSDVTASGSFNIKNASAVNICYLVSGTGPSANDTMVFPNLNNNPNYFLTIRQVASTAPASSVYDGFDLIIVNEIIGGTNAEIVALKSVDKPILNLKSFVYNSGRWNWGTGDNGLSNNGTITVWQPSHPIFKNITLNSDNTLQLISDAAIKGIQPADVTLPGSINIATAPKSTTGNPMAIAIHDVPASVRGVTNSKYILIPICDDSYAKMTDAALTIINNAIDYLLHGEQFQAPSLNISSFIVDGQSANIDNEAKTINASLPMSSDLSSITPAVTLSSTGTTYFPTGAQNFSSSSVNYTVTDLINSKIYAVSLTQSGSKVVSPVINSIVFDGKKIHNPERLNLKVFELSGKLIVESNKDIDLSGKSKGIYIVKSNNDNLKINVK